MNINQIIEEFKSLYFPHHAENSIDINQLVKVSSESWVVFLSDWAHNEYIVGWLSVDNGKIDSSDLNYFRMENDKRIKESYWFDEPFKYCNNEFLKCFHELS